MRYFITFASYGAHLHGDESGSVDRRHNVFGGRLVEADPRRVSAEGQRMLHAPYLLDRESRAVVLKSLQEVCTYRRWNLLAAHVRTNYVHVVVEAEAPPEKIMNDFKAYASRGLNRLLPEGPAPIRWARHGSTRWLFQDHDVLDAIRYVVDEQGEAMAVFVADGV
jgi:REP element-mobilizing transposase RayT